LVKEYVKQGQGHSATTTWRSSTMNELIRTVDGAVVEPSLHDSKLIRIDFGRQQLSMFFQCAGEVFIRVLVKNITLMIGCYLAEENIVLDFVVTDGSDVTDDALSILLPAKTEMQLKYFKTVKAKLSENNLQLLEILPSYGGGIAIICETLEYEQVARPLWR
jgi:hypothetical protein